MNKMTPKELADLAEVAFLADPEMLASTMLSVGATLEDLIQAFTLNGHTEADARRLTSDKLAKNDSQSWRELGVGWATPAVPVLTSVVAKFQTGFIAPVPGGQVYVQMHAVYEADPASPNKAFSDATPSGNFQIWIKDSYPAAKFFKQGKKYLFTITEE